MLAAEAPTADSADRAARRRQRRRRALVMTAVAAAAETAALVARGQRPGRDVLVRCREGHLFTTIWIPVASLKSLRLGLWRFQRCPVGRHWSLVTPVKMSGLSEEERDSAREIRDLPIP
jgi:hypothetical protein